MTKWMFHAENMSQGTVSHSTNFIFNLVSLLLRPLRPMFTKFTWFYPFSEYIRNGFSYFFRLFVGVLSRSWSLPHYFCVPFLNHLLFPLLSQCRKAHTFLSLVKITIIFMHGALLSSVLNIYSRSLFSKNTLWWFIPIVMR